jgi:putative heme-binding domain-containing protein
LERVLEDVLLPNQNVDHAFRSQLFLLESGQVLVGLVQAEDQVSIQLTDQQGKTTTVPVARIDQRQVTPQSLMPGDVAHQYSDATLFGLMCFLMEQDR